MSYDPKLCITQAATVPIRSTSLPWSSPTCLPQTSNAAQPYLGGDTRLQLARDGDPHVLALGLHQGLSGEHMLHLTGANAKGQGAKRAMSGSVRVTAHNDGARQREAL